MKTIQQDLKSSDLNMDDAVDLAQNRPLWRLMSTFGTTHSKWCLPGMMMMMKHVRLECTLPVIERNAWSFLLSSSLWDAIFCCIWFSARHRLLTRQTTTTWKQQMQQNLRQNLHRFNGNKTLLYWHNNKMSETLSKMEMQPWLIAIK